jgi:hypothetical protein
VTFWCCVCLVVENVAWMTGTWTCWLGEELILRIEWTVSVAMRGGEL